MSDWAYEEACREVDELTPSAPPLARTPVRLAADQSTALRFDRCPPSALLPPGTRFDETTDDFVVPGVGRVPLELWQYDKAAFMRATGFVPR